MVLGSLPEIFGHQGLRTIWKVVLLVAAVGYFSFRPDFVTNFFAIKVFDLDLLAVQNIIGALLLLLAWMLHKNQV